MTERAQLPSTVTCPNCGERFPPEDILFISPSIVGDPVVGPEASRRFRPSRFSESGSAIDVAGSMSDEMACPNCHLLVPRAHLDMPSFILSAVGAPASGKSHLLAAMSSQMRRQAGVLGLSITDADPRINDVLHAYEDRLFFAVDQHAPVEIAKTQLNGNDLYQEVLLNGNPQKFPRPFQFILSNKAENRDGQVHRILVCYDSAGEHFQPVYRDEGVTVTKHLAQAHSILFVFDPSQEPGIARTLSADGADITRQRTNTGAAVRQDVIFSEMAWRIRQTLGLSNSKPYTRPLFVVCTKADIWGDQIGWTGDQEPIDQHGRLDVSLLMETSARTRQWLLKHAPQIVNLFEGFAPTIHWLPVSSLGTSPVRVDGATPNAGFWGISPSAVKPRWAAIPLMWAFHVNNPKAVAAV